MRRTNEMNVEAQLPQRRYEVVYDWGRKIAQGPHGSIERDEDDPYPISHAPFPLHFSAFTFSFEICGSLPCSALNVQSSITSGSTPSCLQRVPVSRAPRPAVMLISCAVHVQWRSNRATYSQRVCGQPMGTFYVSSEAQGQSSGALYQIFGRGSCWTRLIGAAELGGHLASSPPSCSTPYAYSSVAPPLPLRRTTLHAINLLVVHLDIFSF